jgi:hypothetical protein
MQCKFNCETKYYNIIFKIKQIKENILYCCIVHLDRNVCVYELIHLFISPGEH